MMDALASFHFIRPLLLLLAPLTVLVWWLWRRAADPLRGWRNCMDAELMEALVERKGTAGHGTAHWLLVAWLTAVVAVAGPTWRPEPSPFAEDATPLLILLKADTSMDQPDPAPSRIERARLKITDLATERRGQPLGLIAYAGSAHLVLPPTKDTEAIAQMAQNIAPEIMPVPGDRLDLALLKAAEIMPGGGAVLVVADSAPDNSAALRAAAAKSEVSVQFLSLAPPDSDGAADLEAAAKSLRAPVQPLTTGDDDIHAVVRAAARAPHGIAGEGETRWEEAGWYLTPVLAALVALSFRRVEEGVQT